MNWKKPQDELPSFSTNEGWQIDLHDKFALRYKVFHHNHHHLQIPFISLDFEVHKIVSFEEDGQPIFSDFSMGNADDPYENPSYVPISGGHFIEGIMKSDGCIDFFVPGEKFLRFYDADLGEEMQFIKIIKEIQKLGSRCFGWPGK